MPPLVLLVWAGAAAFGQTNGLLNDSLDSMKQPAARVLVVHNDNATEAFKPDAAIVRSMVDRGIVRLTETTNVTSAWQSLFSPDDVVGIKVHSAPGPNSGTRPAVVAAVVEGLLAAGHPASRIIIWDKNITDLRLAGYLAFEDRFGVRVESTTGAGWDGEAYYDSPFLGNLLWGDLEFGKKGPGVGRRSFVSKLLTREITKIINVPPMLNHNFTGTAGNLATLSLACVDNTFRFENDAAHLAMAVPEIYALREVGDKVVLSIVDALICQYQGSELSRLHYSSALNELHFSRDPVALDILSIEELKRQRKKAGITSKQQSLDLYHNASLLQLGVSDPDQVEIERIKD